MKLKLLVPAGTPANAKAGETDAQAGMLAHENRRDREGLPSSDVD